VTQHSALTLESWSRYTLEQQILMIANELQRARRFMDVAERTTRTACYERALRLVDLTASARHRLALVRELLRWRDVAAELFLDPLPRPREHAAALRALLLLTPGTAQQIPLLGLEAGSVE
jgi:hypothetical protein